MAKEFERRFLVSKTPSCIVDVPPTTVADCYWPPESDHCQLRMRRTGSKLEITKKVPVVRSDLSVMEEFTIPLTPAEYDALKVAPGKWVVKRRYTIKLQSIKVELGIFEEDLAGLAIADVEFTSEEEMKCFLPLEWFGKEVTNDARLAGGELCGKCFNDLTVVLRSYDFEGLKAA